MSLASVVYIFTGKHQQNKHVHTDFPQVNINDLRQLNNLAG